MRYVMRAVLRGEKCRRRQMPTPSMRRRPFVLITIHHFRLLIFDYIVYARYRYLFAPPFLLI